MRVILVGLVALLLFWMLWPMAQFAILGPDRFGFYPSPTLATWYLAWLFAMALAALVALLPVAFVVWLLWRLMSR